MLVRTMPLIAALMVVSGCGSASGSTPAEVGTARCFAMSLVFNDLANMMNAPAPQREAVTKVRLHFTTKLQNAVAETVKSGGDVKRLEADTQAFLEEVKAEPLKWQEDFRACTEMAMAELGRGSRVVKASSE